MKICFIPIDNRPVCYNLAKEIARIDEEITLYIPPRKLPKYDIQFELSAHFHATTIKHPTHNIK